MAAAFYAYIFATFATLPDAVSATAIIGGGALRAFFDGSKVKDYDLFFRTKADFDAALIEMHASSSSTRTTRIIRWPRCSRTSLPARCST